MTVLNADDHRTTEGATWDFTPLTGGTLTAGATTSEKVLSFRIRDTGWVDRRHHATVKIMTFEGKLLGRLD